MLGKIKTRPVKSVCAFADASHDRLMSPRLTCYDADTPYKRDSKADGQCCNCRTNPLRCAYVRLANVSHFLQDYPAMIPMHTSRKRYSLPAGLTVYDSDMHRLAIITHTQQD